MAVKICRMCGESMLRNAGKVRGYQFYECEICDFFFTLDVEKPIIGHRRDAKKHSPDNRRLHVSLEPAIKLLKPEKPLKILELTAGGSQMQEPLHLAGHYRIAVNAEELTASDQSGSDSSGSLTKPDSFDLVCAFQLFEHLPQPSVFLDRIVEVCRPGGLVLINTDMETPEREKGFSRWPYVMPPEHCSFYRHKTFSVFIAGKPLRLASLGPKEVIIQKT